MLTLARICLIFLSFIMSSAFPNLIQKKDPPHGFFTEAWQKKLLQTISNGDFPTWMHEQIHEDLSPFYASGISLTQLESVIKQYPTSSFVFFTIHNNQLFFQTYGELHDDDRTRILIQKISDLVRTVDLPNVSFVVYIGEAFTEVDSRVPVFSWCKHVTWSVNTICIPDYDALSGNVKFLEQVEEGIKLYPWEKKDT